MGERTLVNIIGGFLGVGKTTAINHLLQQRPDREKWAVVVNEFGDIGIDGSLLGAETTLRDYASRGDAASPGNDAPPGSGSSLGGRTTPEGVVLHEIPGGCICCTAGFAFQDAVVRLLRRERPHRLLIEPTGIATLRSIIDTLRQPGLAEAVELRTILTLVDPAHWISARHRSNDTYRDQIEAADVLLANRGDLSEPRATEQFLRDADELFPPKRQVAVIAHGQIDVALLDSVRESRSEAQTESGADPEVSGQAQAQAESHADSGPPPQTDAHARPAAAPPGEAAAAISMSSLERLTRWEPHSGPLVPGASRHLVSSYRSGGRTFPREVIFDEHCLAEWIAAVRRAPGLLRLKGVFHTTGGWIAYNATPQEQSVRVASHRRDSRVEWVLAVGETPPTLEAPAQEEATRARTAPGVSTSPESSTFPATSTAPHASTAPNEFLPRLERCRRG